MVISRALFLLAALAGAAFSNDLLTSYRIEGLRYAGPGEWRHPADPIWVWEYHTVRLSYRGSGMARTGAPVLTLRPDAVRPATPGANNPENPSAAGLPLVVIAARDIVADGAVHTLTIELRSTAVPPARRGEPESASSGVSRRSGRLSPRWRRRVPARPPPPCPAGRSSVWPGPGKRAASST